MIFAKLAPVADVGNATTFTAFLVIADTIFPESSPAALIRNIRGFSIDIMVITANPANS
jgi:hypothetical protein